MTDVQELYSDLADWVDVSNHPDKARFDSLLSALVQGVIDRAIEDTRIDANSGTEHINLVEEYAKTKGYERFFTSD